ncbi:MAG: hypothetical protein LAO55_16025 [Acidobacteriia bacterium]|nr:hypothetical protein [Terriglobia bacterium]
MAKEHHIRLFVVDAKVFYIHHKPSDPNNDKPGNHASGLTKDKVKFQGTSRFSIEFKTESPFVHDEGAPGSPIRSNNGSPTPLFELKPIAAGSIENFPYTAQIGGLTDDPEIIIDDSGGGGTSAKKKTVKSKKKKKK